MNKKKILFSFIIIVFVLGGFLIFLEYYSDQESEKKYEECLIFSTTDLECEIDWIRFTPGRFLMYIVSVFFIEGFLIYYYKKE